MRERNVEPKGQLFAVFIDYFRPAEEALFLCRVSNIVKQTQVPAALSADRILTGSRVHMTGESSFSAVSF